MLLCERTDVQYDLDVLLMTYEKISQSLGKDKWRYKQTALQYAVNPLRPHTDACGSFSKRIMPDLGIEKQEEFRHLNPEYKDTIFEEILTKHNAIRTRLMWRSTQTTYSVHYDMDSWRYHIALYTNPHAYVIYPKGYRELYLKRKFPPNLTDAIFHIPADGYVYRMRTDVPHSVANCGKEDRLHIAWGSNDFL